MTSGSSRTLGTGLIAAGALLLATGGALLGRARLQPPQTADDGPAVAAADALFGRVAPTITARAQQMEGKAKNAARVPELVSGIDIGADTETFEDLLNTEDWWSSFRAEFPVSGLVSPQGPVAMLGPSLGDVSASRIVRQARDEGVASGVAAGRDVAFFLAAARVPRGKHGTTGMVVVLGTPIDQVALRSVIDATTPSIPLAIADARHILAETGPETSRSAFQELLAKQASNGGGDMAAGRRVHGMTALGEGMLGSTFSLGDGLRLMALFPGAPATPRGLGDGAGLPVLIAGVGLAVLGLLLRFGRRQSRLDAMAGIPVGFPDASSIPTPFPRHAMGPAHVGHSQAAVAMVPPVGAEPASAAQRRSDHGLVPMRMGRYELLERIGEGGMAEICIAAAHGAEGFVRRFVVKRMHAHLARNREAVNQFIDEARLQSGLVHSNIVPVYDFGKVGDEYFIALEYIHGRDLERVVRRHIELYGRALSVPVAFYIVQEVLEALAYAHTRMDPNGKLMEIVHRDVTPANILISFRGEVKLSDFGIAKAGHRVSKTELGTLKGNASFMSPEQARGEPVDARSDLFSAGVVLYYCLTGQFLYGDDEAMLKRLLRAAVGPATAEHDQIDQIPDRAAGIIRRALAFDPSERFQSARDFARELLGHYTGGRAELADLMRELFPDERRESS